MACVFLGNCIYMKLLCLISYVNLLLSLQFYIFEGLYALGEIFDFLLKLWPLGFRPL